MSQSKIRRLLIRCTLVIVMCCSFFFSDPAYALVKEGDTATQQTKVSQKISSLCNRPPNIGEITNYFRDESQAASLANDDPDCYAWAAFIYLNWPSLAEYPWLPDRSKNISTPGPVVWEGWKEVKDVYLPKGAQPQRWDVYVPPPQEVLDKAKNMGLDVKQPFHNMGLIQQVSGLVFKSNEDKFNQPIRYEIAMNQSTFDYIKNNKLYNINGQEALAKQCADTLEKKCINFDWSSMEVKASWLWLYPDNPKRQEIEDRYIVANAYYQKLDEHGKPVINYDGKPVYEVGRAALTGIHIISKALPKWVWTTFENKYNSEYTTSTVELPIPDRAQKLNAFYQDQFKGTKYVNYELIDTQIDFEKPVLLANSQIESDFQKKSSCITCHAIASVTRNSSDPSVPFRLSFVDSRGGDLTYYVGNLPEEIQQKLENNYITMDFLWSLRLARRDRSAPPQQ